MTFAILKCCPESGNFCSKCSHQKLNLCGKNNMETYNTFAILTFWPECAHFCSIMRGVTVAEESFVTWNSQDFGRQMSRTDKTQRNYIFKGI